MVQYQRIISWNNLLKIKKTIWSQKMGRKIRRGIATFASWRRRVRSPYGPLKHAPDISALDMSVKGRIWQRGLERGKGLWCSGNTAGWHSAISGSNPDSVH